MAQMTRKFVGGTVQSVIVAQDYELSTMGAPENPETLLELVHTAGVVVTVLGYYYWSGSAWTLIGNSAPTQAQLTNTPSGGVPELLYGDSKYPVTPPGSTVAKSNQEPFKNHATSSYNFIGFDAVSNTVYVNDTTGGGLRIGTSSDNWQTQGGTTWSNAKGWPTGVTYASVSRLVRFGAYIYLLALDTSDSVRKIWRALPTTGNTALTWSAPLLAYQDINATSLFTSMDADASYIYACEYTQQVSWTPRVYRSADGVTWETVINESVAGVVRHFHCIAADPYNPGHVYLTCGDGIAKTLQRSTDYGATWTVIETSSVWQAVQISFSQDYVYFAGDSQNGVAYKLDRTTLEKRWITPWLFKNIPVPAIAALGDTFCYNAWYGCIDPTSGDFYSIVNDVSAGGNIYGIFLTREGEMPVLVQKTAAIEAPAVIAGGVLWCGKQRKILNSY